MSLWGFRPVPVVIRSVPLLPGDRRLAWSLTTGGAPVLASAFGLTLPGAGLLEWHLVERITWQRPQLVVVRVAEPPAVGRAVVAGTGSSIALTLVEGGRLPEVVRARVTDSVVWSRHLALTQGGVRVVGRRQRSETAFAWQLVYDLGTDLEDPLVQAAAEGALTAARRTIG